MMVAPGDVGDRMVFVVPNPKPSHRWPARGLLTISFFEPQQFRGPCSTPELLKPVLKPSDYGLACSLVSMLFEMSPKSTLFAILNLLPTSPLKPHGAPPPCLYDTNDVTKMLLSPFQPHPTKTPPDHSPDKNSSEKSRPGRSTELCDTREPKTREAIVENRPSTLTILL